MTYEHWLQDSINEIYQFKGSVPTPFMNADGDKTTTGTLSKSKAIIALQSSAGRDSVSITGSFATAPTNEGFFMTAESQSTGRPPPTPLTRQGQQKSLSSSSTASENTHSPNVLSPDSVATSSIPLSPDASPTDTKDKEHGALVTQRHQRAESIASAEEAPLPSGATGCYSPTCTKDRLCYSVAYPRSRQG